MNNTSWDTANNVASITGILSALVALSATIIQKNNRSARLDSARQILDECQGFMNSLRTNNHDLIMELHPLFFDQMTQHLGAYVQLVCGGYPSVL